MGCALAPNGVRKGGERANRRGKTELDRKGGNREETEERQALTSNFK